MQNRPLRPFEEGAHLHVLDWAHQTARYRLQAAGATQVKAAAQAGATPYPVALPALEAAVHGELRSLYALGVATVRSELDHQATKEPFMIGIGTTLARNPDDAIAPLITSLAVADTVSRETRALAARARLIAQAVAHAIHQAIHRGRLAGVTGKRSLQNLGETAGNQALSVAATHHAGGVINLGRRHAASQNPGIIGARYTSVLDKNTCGPCKEADTGRLLAVDSPEWVPTPNPSCLGGDRCRCIHVYQLAAEAEALPIAAAR